MSSSLPPSFWSRFKKGLFGPPRNLKDPALSHKLALIAFFAWVGLGADGLSSSAYGPEEAFRALGEHSYLAIFLVLATALTVFIISYAYSRIIEHFPVGGGGYIVATNLLGKRAGVVSGCALFVDYILTITISIAGGGDALFSLLPLSWHWLKLPVEFAAIVFLIVMNLRGVKESVMVLMPIFVAFVLTHLVLIVSGIVVHLSDVAPVIGKVKEGLHMGVTQLGIGGLFLLFLRAYSLGGGTYTGIEAVSNGVGILREPKVKTGKRTMLYMALSLALTAGGLILCYMLVGARHVEGETLNATLSRTLLSGFRWGGLPMGQWLVYLTMFSEAVLLLVAAQTGFIDGPRIMANMALDGWVPKSFASLSDRLTMQNGILLIGVASLAALAYTAGDVGLLVVMYSINVFLTFSLSELGMIRFWIRHRKEHKTWLRDLSIHLTGFILCFSILCVMVFEKLKEGAWITLVITCLCIVLCFLIKKHYENVRLQVAKLDHAFENLPSGAPRQQAVEFDPEKPIAVILVSNYSGLGVHILLNIFRLFPGAFRNVIFASVATVDSEFFKETEQLKRLSERTESMLRQYTDFSEKIGIPARYEYHLGTDVVEAVSELCVEISKRYPHVVFFAGELVFEKTQWYQRLLHNETAYAVLRRIRFAGLPMVMVPARITDTKSAPDLRASAGGKTVAVFHE